MVLLDEQRRHVDANAAYLKLLGYKRTELVGRPVYEFVEGGPIRTQRQWDADLREGRFHGEATMLRKDGGTVAVQWAGVVEVVTGHRLVLFVALATSRWGGRFRREDQPKSDQKRALAARAGGRPARRARPQRPEIADELHIAHHTVRTHVRNAMEKLHARSRAHLVAKAVGGGIVHA